MLRYIKAPINDVEKVFDLVQGTIKAIYPKYYPKEVVDFFCEHHCRENIIRDINAGCVGLLYDGEMLVGTGSYQDNHITRVYVSPTAQGRGYGTFIIQRLEEEIKAKHDVIYLDASLPASHLYEKLGYRTIKHEKWDVENDVVLVYEVMEKQLDRADSAISYDGKFFVPQSNSENGEVSSQTVFAYHQNGNVLWAEYEGGDIVKGNLLGTVAQNGELDFHYQHLNVNGQVRVGKCHSVPNVLENGKIQLMEAWQWLNGDQSKGSSVLVER